METFCLDISFVLRWFCILMSFLLASLSFSVFSTLQTKFILCKTTSQYFVRQDFHTVLPSTTSYYKACTKYSQFYIILQSLHKVPRSTTSYYKACTKYFPVLLRTTKLAQNTSQYYFVPQSLHRILPSTNSYYKACKKILASTTWHCKTCRKFSLHPYSLSVPTLFTSLLSSQLYSLHILTLLLYSLHIPTTLFTSLLSSHPYSLHIPTLFTSLLSSHPYSPYISTLFTPLLSHISTLSHLYSLHIPTF